MEFFLAHTGGTSKLERKAYGRSGSRFHVWLPDLEVRFMVARAPRSRSRLGFPIVAAVLFLLPTVLSILPTASASHSVGTITTSLTWGPPGTASPTSTNATLPATNVIGPGYRINVSAIIPVTGSCTGTGTPAVTVTVDTTRFGGNVSDTLTQNGNLYHRIFTVQTQETAGRAPNNADVNAVFHVNATCTTDLGAPTIARAQRTPSIRTDTKAPEFPTNVATDLLSYFESPTVRRGAGVPPFPEFGIGARVEVKLDWALNSQSLAAREWGIVNPGVTPRVAIDLSEMGGPSTLPVRNRTTDPATKTFNFTVLDSSLEGVGNFDPETGGTKFRLRLLVTDGAGNVGRSAGLASAESDKIDNVAPSPGPTLTLRRLEYGSPDLNVLNATVRGTFGTGVGDTAGVRVQQGSNYEAWTCGTTPVSETGDFCGRLSAIPITGAKAVTIHVVDDAGNAGPAQISPGNPVETRITKAALLGAGGTLVTPSNLTSFAWEISNGTSISGTNEEPSAYFWLRKAGTKQYWNGNNDTAADIVFGNFRYCSQATQAQPYCSAIRIRTGTFNAPVGSPLTGTSVDFTRKPSATVARGLPLKIPSGSYELGFTVRAANNVDFNFSALLRIDGNLPSLAQASSSLVTRTITQSDPLQVRLNVTELQGGDSGLARINVSLDGGSTLDYRYAWDAPARGAASRLNVTCANCTALPSAATPAHSPNHAPKLAIGTPPRWCVRGILRADEVAAASAPSRCRRVGSTESLESVATIIQGLVPGGKAFADNGVNRTLSDGTTQTAGGNLANVFQQYRSDGQKMGPFGLVSIAPEAWRLPVGRYRVTVAAEDFAGNRATWPAATAKQVYVNVTPRLFPAEGSPAVLANGKLYLRFGASYDNLSDSSHSPPSSAWTPSMGPGIDAGYCDATPATAAPDYVCPVSDFKFYYRQQGDTDWTFLQSTSGAENGAYPATSTRPVLYNYSLEGVPVNVPANVPVYVRVVASVTPFGSTYEYASNITDFLVRRVGIDSPARINNPVNPAEPYKPWMLWPDGTAQKVKFNASITIDSYATVLEPDGAGGFKMPVARWTLQRLDAPGRPYYKVDDAAGGLQQFTPADGGAAPAGAIMTRTVNYTICKSPSTGAAGCGAPAGTTRVVQPRATYNFSAPNGYTTSNPFNANRHWVSNVTLPEGTYLLNVTFYRNAGATTPADKLGESKGFGYFAIESTPVRVAVDYGALDENGVPVTDVVTVGTRRYVDNAFNVSLDITTELANYTGLDLANDLRLERVTVVGNQQKVLRKGESGVDFTLINATQDGHLYPVTHLNVTVRLPNDAKSGDQFRFLMDAETDLGTWGATAAVFRVTGPTPGLTVILDASRPEAEWDNTAQGANATGLAGSRTQNYRGDALEWVVSGNVTDGATLDAGSGARNVEVRIVDLTRGLTWNEASAGWNPGTTAERWAKARLAQVGGKDRFYYGERALDRELAKNATDGTNAPDPAAFPGDGTGVAKRFNGSTTLNLTITVPPSGTSTTIPTIVTVRARNSSPSSTTTDPVMEILVGTSGGSFSSLGTFPVRSTTHRAYATGVVSLAPGDYTVRLAIRDAVDAHFVSVDVVDLFRANGLRAQLDASTLYRVDVRGSDRVGNALVAESFLMTFDASIPVVSGVRFNLPAIPPRVPSELDLGTTNPAGTCLTTAGAPSAFRCVSWHGRVNGSIRATATITDDNCVARVDLVVRMGNGWTERAPVRNVKDCRGTLPPLPAWTASCASTENTATRLVLTGCPIPARMMNQSGTEATAKANFIWFDAWDGVNQKNLTLPSTSMHRFRVIDDHAADLRDSTRWVPSTAGAGGVATLNVDVFEDYRMGKVTVQFYRNRADGTIDAANPLAWGNATAADVATNGTGRWVMRTSDLRTPAGENVTLEIGVYTALVVVRDAAQHGEATCPEVGNACSGYILIVKEGAPPAIQVDAPSETTQFVNGTFAFKATVFSGSVSASGITLKLGNSTANLTTALPETKIELLNGKQVAIHVWHNVTLARDDVPLVLTLRALDATGLADDAEREWSIDVTPPTVEGAFDASRIVGPTTFVRGSAKFEIEATDAKSGIAAVTCRVNGGEPRSCAEPFSLTGQDGTYTIAYTAVDRAGNAAPQQTTTVALDKTGPALSVTKNSDDLIVTVDDAGAGVDESNVTAFWSNEESAPQQFTALRMSKVAGNSFRATLPNATGTIWYYLRALDAIGNVGSRGSSAAPLRVGGSVTPPPPGENQPPELTITAPTPGSSVSRPVTLRWTASDPEGDPVTVTISYASADGSVTDTIATNLPGSQREFPWTASTVADGAYEVTLIADDGELTTEKSVSFTIKLDQVLKPERQPPTNVEQGQPANFAVSVTASKPVDEVVAEIFKDGQKVTEVKMAAGAGGVYGGQYVPQSPGRYLARVSVKYADGTSEAPLALSPFTVQGAGDTPVDVIRGATTQLIALVALSAATILAAAYAAFVRWKP